MAAIVLTLFATPAAQASGAGSVSETSLSVDKPAPDTTSSSGRHGNISIESRPDSRYLQLVTSRLRSAIQERRFASFRHADWLGVERHKTAYRERYTRSVPYLRWLRSLWSHRAHRLWRLRNHVPVGEAQLRAYINDDCLEEIIDRESAGTWSPTVRNYTDGIAYGLPQARPGYKMASAGADWETNPKTQIAWMRGYVNGRYGGSCSALAHHNASGWY